MTAAIISANNATQAAMAAARSAVERTECQESMPGFAHLTATIEQRQHYADCVRVMHPTENSAIGALLLIALVVSGVLLLGWAVTR